MNIFKKATFASKPQKAEDDGMNEGALETPWTEQQSDDDDEIMNSDRSKKNITSRSTRMSKAGNGMYQNYKVDNIENGFQKVLNPETVRDFKSQRYHNTKLTSLAGRSSNDFKSANSSNLTQENNENSDDSQTQSPISSQESSENELDQEFFEKHCKAIEITERIDKHMIIEFVKNSQLFAKIQVVFDLTEKEKMKLYGLYQQATKGDYAKNTVQGLLSIFSGPNNLEKVAWQKQNGTPREEAMHNWVYDVKKLIDPLYLDKLNARCVVDARLKEKPTIKSLKVFYSYLDHFVVIHREYRHFTRSQITETLQSVESAYNEDGEDNTPLFQNAREKDGKKFVKRPFKLQTPYDSNILLNGILKNEKNKSSSKMSLNINIEDLKKKIVQINEEQNKKLEILKKQKLNWAEIKNMIYNHQQLKAVEKIQILFRRRILKMVMTRRVGKQGSMRALSQLIRSEIIASEEKKVQDDISMNTHDNNQDKEKRKEFKDWWVGKIMAQFPHHFIDMKLQNLGLDGLFTQCRNCKKVLNAAKEQDKLFWHSPKHGYFCQQCINPKNTDFKIFLEQVKQNPNNYPIFDGYDRIKENAIKIRNNRPTQIKGFCYKNQDKNIRKMIFPQKWSWRINERRNHLLEHEFLNPRHKRTQKMDDLLEYWPKALQKHSPNITKGYKKKVDDETKFKIKEARKLYEIERKMTGMNVIHFKNIKNISIMTYSDVYEDMEDLKSQLKMDFRIIVRKAPSEPEYVTETKLQIIPKSSFQKQFFNDPKVNQYLDYHLPMCYIKQEKKIGFINKTCDLINSVEIEAMQEPRHTILVPCSSKYQIIFQNDKKERVEKFKQLFNLCFFIAPNHNIKYTKGKHYKNRGILQVFEIEADWMTVEEKLVEQKLNVTNQKLVFNVNINGERSVHQNILSNGQINGIKVFDEVSSKLLILDRSEPFEYTFQNEITFCRYQKYYKHMKPYQNDRSQILLIEVQLTTNSKKKLYNYQQIMVLSKAIKVLMNHVPYDMEQHEKYGLAEDEDKAIKMFIESSNWLQPIGALGCRSLASFMFKMDNFSEAFDNVTLKFNAQPTLLDQFKKDQPKLFDSLYMQKSFEPYTQMPDEMSFDLSCRNPIHDALDQDKLFEMRAPLQTLLDLVCMSRNQSADSREILIGLMHRILADQNNNLKQHYKNFFTDNSDNKDQISKFAVRFSSNILQRYAKKSHQVNYYNNISHINTEVTIENSYEKRKAMEKRFSRRGFLMRRRPQQQNADDSLDSAGKDIEDLDDINADDEKRTDLSASMRRKSRIMNRGLATFEVENQSVSDHERPEPMKNPIRKSSLKLVNINKQLLSNNTRNGMMNEVNLEYTNEEKVITDLENRSHLNSNDELKLFSKSDERQISIIDYGIKEGGEESGSSRDSSEYQQRSDDSSDLEGGNQDEDDDDQASMQQQNQDSEDEYQVEHFYIDFRHTFLQANLQNIIGKPRHQVLNEELTKFQPEQIVLSRFYNSQGFKNNLEQAQISEIIYQIFKDEIENMLSLKMLSDCQFIDSEKVMKGLGVIYCLMMILPFKIQLHLNNQVLVVWCLMSMLIMNSVMFGVEIIQINQLSWHAYRQEKWNFIEMFGILFVYIYVILRIVFIEDPILPDIEFNQSLALRLRGWVVLNTFVFFSQMVKLLYFLRVNMEMSKIVKLTTQVFSDVGAFTVYLVIWITVFVQLYEIAGISLFNDITYKLKYDYLDNWVALWIQAFRNALGDINEPTATYWINNEDVDQTTKHVIIYYAWFLFLGHEFFLCVCLLNFLIAIVSQSYDYIMDKQTQETVDSKIYFNIQAAIIFDAIEVVIRLKRPVSQTFHMIVDLNEYEHQENDFQGFVRTMKMYFLKENKITRRQMKQNTEEMGKRIEQVQQQQVVMFKKMMQKLDTQYEMLTEGKK